MHQRGGAIDLSNLNVSNVNGCSWISAAGKHLVVFCDHSRSAHSVAPYKVRVGLSRRSPPSVCLLYGDVICSQESTLQKKKGYCLFLWVFMEFLTLWNVHKRENPVIPSPRPNGSRTFLARRTKLHFYPFSVGRWGGGWRLASSQVLDVITCACEC